MKLEDIIKSLKPGEAIILGKKVIITSGTESREVFIDEDRGIPTVPPTGHFKVTNLYVDSATGKMVVEYDNTPAP